jgi:hypothetical protein
LTPNRDTTLKSHRPAVALTAAQKILMMSMVIAFEGIELQFGLIVVKKLTGSHIEIVVIGNHARQLPKKCESRSPER